MFRFKVNDILLIMASNEQNNTCTIESLCKAYSITPLAARHGHSRRIYLKEGWKMKSVINIDQIRKISVWDKIRIILKHPSSLPYILLSRRIYRRYTRENISKEMLTVDTMPFMNKGIVYGSFASGKTSQLQNILLGKTGKGLYICKECELIAPDASMDVITSDDSGKLDGILKSRITYDFVVVDVSNTDPSFCQKATRLFVNAVQNGKGGVIAVNCTGKDYLEALSWDYNREYLAKTQGKPQFNGERQVLLDDTKRKLRKIFTETFTAALDMKNLKVERRTSVTEDYR